jgi:MoaA/NifB/PqqE/SkfB family radical SAM enzyme
MMIGQSLYRTYKRYRTLQTDVIHSLPLVVLMPHSACNCRCIMCDIWKGNKHLKQLTESDIESLLSSLARLGTQQVLMSGGEALLNQNFFKLCDLLKRKGLSVSLLSTGLTLAKHARQLIRYVDDIIVSLDGPEELHDRIRNIPSAYAQLRDGVKKIKNLQPHFRIAARTVIHRHNYHSWKEIIRSAKEMGLDQISFLPADVSSHAFNREILWDRERQHEILPAWEDLSPMKTMIEEIISEFNGEIQTRFIAEHPEKLQRIYQYYSACHGLNAFPYKKCNAPWVSTVIEADGTVRPCFFHASLGNIREQSLEEILNKKESIAFRKTLDMDSNATCVRCVCYLNLAPATHLK